MTAESVHTRRACVCVFTTPAVAGGESSAETEPQDGGVCLNTHTRSGRVRITTTNTVRVLNYTHNTRKCAHFAHSFHGGGYVV